MEAEAPERLAQAESFNWDMAAALQEATPELWAETVGAFAQVSAYSAPDMTYHRGGRVQHGAGQRRHHVHVVRQGAGARCQFHGILALQRTGAVEVGSPSLPGCVS